MNGKEEITVGALRFRNVAFSHATFWLTGTAQIEHSVHDLNVMI